MKTKNLKILGVLNVTLIYHCGMSLVSLSIQMAVYVIDIIHIDICFIGFFNIVFFVMFVISPNKLRFIQDPMNNIDIMALNMVAILLLGLGLLLVLVAVAILTYSSLVYFAERETAEGLNCTGWEPDYSSGNLGDAINHPCYSWTFVDSFFIQKLSWAR